MTEKGILKADDTNELSTAHNPLTQRQRNPKPNRLMSGANVLQVNSLCHHYQSRHGHREVVAQYYCFQEGIYICDECFSDHKDHNGMGDSIKNHLGRLFNEWLRLQDYANNIIQAKLNVILDKQRAFFNALVKGSKIQPDIDIFTLQIIVNNYIQRIRIKIQQIREQCQKNNLNQALQMRKEMFDFKRQLIELDERASNTQLLACYFKSDDPNSQLHDPVAINLSIFDMLETSANAKQSSRDKPDANRALSGSSSKSSFVSNKAEGQNEKQKAAMEFKEPKSTATLTFSQVAFLLRKQYDNRMQ